MEHLAFSRAMHEVTPPPMAWSAALTGFATWMRAASRAESTITLRLYWIRRLAESSASDSPVTITEEEITTWLAQGPWKPATRKSALASIRRFFAWMDLYSYRPTNPTTCLLNVPAPSYRARPTPDTVLRKALETAPDTESSLMLMLPAYAGLRRQEIAALHTSSVELQWLTINGKGNRVRRVPIHPELEPLLELKSAGYYFPSPRAPHRSPDYVGRRIARLLGSGYTAHQLRHWFATRAYDATRDIRAVQELLGHANVVTTQTYVGLTDEVLAHTIEALPVIDLLPVPASATTGISPDTHRKDKIMAVQTHYEVTFTCGHTETRDLSDRPAGKRASFAKWLARNGDCVDCWKKEHKDDRRLAQLEVAASNAKKLELPELEGSEAQLAWAPIFRNDLIIGAHSDLTEGDDAAMTEEEFDTRILTPARSITYAGWWMDNSGAASEDLEELVSTALDDGDAAENPF